MYNPLLHQQVAASAGDTMSSSSSFTHSLPRPVTSSQSKLNSAKQRFRSRSRSPGRSQLSLVICPDFLEHPEGMREYSRSNSPLASPSPVTTKFKNTFTSGVHPLQPHAVARARGTEVLRDTASLPCSPVFSRLGVPSSRFLNVAREMSLPSSPTLPRIRVQDLDATVSR